MKAQEICRAGVATSYEAEVLQGGPGPGAEWLVGFSAPCSLLANVADARALLCRVNTKHKQKQTYNLAILG